MNNKSRHILIACTGSVATIKLPLLVAQLRAAGEARGIEIAVKVVVTERAKHFIDRTELQDVELLSDEDEWSAWRQRGDPVLHIELGKWADLMLIAPLDANSLAKIAGGLCDNLLLCTVRAWDGGKPLLFAPAMNTRMWEHPLTGTQIDVLRGWGYKEVPCVAKTLMCGDTGVGAMAEVPAIVAAVFETLEEKD